MITFVLGCCYFLVLRQALRAWWCCGESCRETYAFSNFLARVKPSLLSVTGISRDHSQGAEHDAGSKPELSRRPGGRQL